MYHREVFFFLCLGLIEGWICRFSLLTTRIVRFFHCDWNMHYSKIFVSSTDYSLCSFQVISSLNLRNFITCMCWSLSTWRLRGYPLQACFLSRSLLWYSSLSPANSSFPDSGKQVGSVRIFPPHTGNLSVNELGKIVSLSEKHVRDAQCLKTVISRISFSFLVVSGRGVNPIPVIASWLEPVETILSVFLSFVTLVLSYPKVYLGLRVKYSFHFFFFAPTWIFLFFYPLYTLALTLYSWSIMM